MTVAIVVICEGPADYRTGCGFADRLISHHIDWITDDVIADYRHWRGITPQTQFCLWKHVGDLARDRGIRAYGHFADEPAEPDALVARRALRLVATLEDAPSAVVLLRDDDGQKERERGLKQARDEAKNIGIPVVIGLAHTKRECWVLAGFEPQDDDERSRFAAIRQELGFDPTREAQRLDARTDGAKKNAVRVLQALIGNDVEREDACLLKTDLAVLRQRGEHSGLRNYIVDIEEILVPLFRS